MKRGLKIHLPGVNVDLPAVKLGLYALLLIVACTFGLRFRVQYKALMNEHGAEASTDLDVHLRNYNQAAAPNTELSHLIALGGIFFGAAVVLGLLVSHDISGFVAQRALKVLYNDDLEGVHNPDYEKAEAAWSDGRFLEAIGLLREYLEHNPSEQHAALRIAEIYEKDLTNYLAAALEYEQVLKHKIEPERWGWAAIHLCNLYYKIDKEAQAEALLRRVVHEYGQTAAAAKARKRLGLAEATPAEAEPASESSAGSDLPPGFTRRPK